MYPEPATMPHGLELRDILQWAQRFEATPKFAGVYFLIYHRVVVYVGQSVDVPQRVRQHYVEGKRFDSWHYIETIDRTRFSLEQHYIKKFRPLYNGAYMAAVQGKSEGEETIIEALSILTRWDDDQIIKRIAYYDSLMDGVPKSQWSKRMRVLYNTLQQRARGDIK